MSVEARYLRPISGEARGVCPALARAGLRLAEAPFEMISTLRNQAYDRGLFTVHPLGRPVISVGNITAGGTGKTPVVQWLAGRLQRDGHRPAILTRGYRKAGALASDEASLLAESLPGVRVEVNANRVAGAAAVLAADDGTDCFVLDDGMQHRRAGRDVDLVLISAVCPFGYGHLHPRGLLREPLSSLSRAGAILITHASEVPAPELDALQQRVARYALAPTFHADHLSGRLLHDEEVVPLECLRQRRFLAFTGIGRPQTLERQLRAYGDSFVGLERFGDHHEYVSAEVSCLADRARASGAELLLTTEKDWVKLRKLPAPPLPVYRLELMLQFWEGEEEPFYRLITAPLRDANLSAPYSGAGQ